jgi:hypothetical protein
MRIFTKTNSRASKQAYKKDNYSHSKPSKDNKNVLTNGLLALLEIMASTKNLIPETPPRITILEMPKIGQIHYLEE